MQIKQWEDKYLSHFSYAVLSDCEKKIVLIDPARNLQPYLDFATENNASIIGIIETHPHADFVSSHQELHGLTGATVYISKKVEAQYAHQPFDEGDDIVFGKIRLYALNTPGHSPDSISIVLEHDGVPKAVFTGDTLFIGDCGRPDLRENAGFITAAKKDLAQQMYTSLRQKLMTLPGDVKVYPAHGAGSLCGKALSNAHSSTIGAEKISNWSLQPMPVEAFVEKLLTDQPFIPAYFPYNVSLNRQGAPAFSSSLKAVPVTGLIKNEADAAHLEKDIWIVDTRSEKAFKKGHLPHSINLMDGAKFETWLGSMLMPGEPFYLAAADSQGLQRLPERTAAIGYETAIAEAFVLNLAGESSPQLNVTEFTSHQQNYTIIDVRNTTEVKEKKIFSNSPSIPLAELRQRLPEIPTDKPIVVHCAGGYRSAAASSLLQAGLKGKTKVYDLGDAVTRLN